MARLGGSNGVIKPGPNKGSGSTRVLNRPGQHMPLGPHEKSAGLGSALPKQTGPTPKIHEWKR